MPSHNELTTVNLADQGVTTQTNTTGEFSNIVEIEVPSGYRYEFPSGHPIEAYIYTHETGTASASGTTQIDLSHNLIDSPAVRNLPMGGAETEINGPHDLVVWEDDDNIQTDVDASGVDYDANHFDYTESDGNETDLQVWYLWGDSSQLEFRDYSTTEQSYEKQLTKSVRQFHEADAINQNSYITFPNSFTLMEKEKLALSLKTDVDLTNWDVRASNPIGPGSHSEIHGYSDIHIPVKKIAMKA